MIKVKIGDVFKYRDFNSLVVFLSIDNISGASNFGTFEVINYHIERVPCYATESVTEILTKTNNFKIIEKDLFFCKKRKNFFLKINDDKKAFLQRVKC